MNRDFLRSDDFDGATIQKVFDLCGKLKTRTKRREYLDVLKGYSAAMVFQKPSLRTRVTFDLALNQLGGHAVYLSPGEISIGVRESVYDVAKNLERWVDLIIARVFAQSIVDGLAEAAAPPVINALSDDEHPCQAMADYFTLLEHGLTGKDVRLAYVGDGNNVAHSLMIIGASLGCDVRIAGPSKYAPAKASVELATKLNARSGGKLLVTSDWKAAVRGANAVYTDVWASMGQESEAQERRAPFEPYQLNAAMMREAERGAFVMHDLPAHRGEEITDEVMDGPTSIVFDQAENRLHAQKAVILECLGFSDSVLRGIGGASGASGGGADDASSRPLNAHR